MADDGVARDGLRAGDMVIVTGGGGGFGRGFSLRLASMGARIAVWDISEKDGAETTRLVRETGGVAQFFQVDLADPVAIEACISSTIAAMGTPYGVINNVPLRRGPPCFDFLIEDAV